jgi:hypothetical protein
MIYSRDHYSRLIVKILHLILLVNKTLELYVMCIGIVNNGLELWTSKVVGALAFKLGAIFGVGYILGACFACLLF